MLFDPAKPLAAGSTIELTLSFRMPDGKIVKQTVEAEVRTMDAAAGGDGHEGHDMNKKGH
eukprot:gene9664-11855_t